MAVLAALLVASLFAPQQKPAEMSAISGTVVDARTGLPLARVVLLAEQMKEPNPLPASTTTDINGSFEMSGYLRDSTASRVSATVI